MKIIMKSLDFNVYMEYIRERDTSSLIASYPSKKNQPRCVRVIIRKIKSLLIHH